MSYTRPWKSFAEQLALIESRGMEIGDHAAAQKHLERVGYYRLSAYWYPFRARKIQVDPQSGKITRVITDAFVPATHFLDAVELYVFDKQLRLIMLDALERIEVALRVDIAYLLGKRDTFAHLQTSQLHLGFASKMNKSGISAHAGWVDHYKKLVSRSREDFVKHYQNRHGPDLPIWVAVEVLDFGALSQLFAMMKVPDQERIAGKYGVKDWRAFQSWLRSLSYLRNLVAHHSRLWNRNVEVQPKLPTSKDIDWCRVFDGDVHLQAKPFLLFAICRHLLLQICPNTEWHLRLKNHLHAFPAQRAQQRRTVEDIGESLETTRPWRAW